MRDRIDQARWLAVLVATAIALYLCWLMLRPFLSVLAWAVVLVIVFYPVHKQLGNRIKRRSLRALLSCVLVVLVIVLPLTVLTVAVAEELAKALPNLPLQAAELAHHPRPLLGRTSEWLNDRFGVDTVRFQEFFIQQLRNSGERLVGASFNLMGNIVSSVIKAFFVIFTMYYLFRDSDKIVARLPDALPLRREQSEA